jgi:serine/threonine-protein kinase
MSDNLDDLPKLSRLGRYEILSELGKGAMGVVYLAKDPSIGRLVAIKTIRSSSPGEDDSESREFRQRFTREAQTAGILSHPNIVTIYDVGEDTESRVSYIAMEYIEGKTLKSMIAEKANFGSDQVADIIAQVAEALDYAHRKGIVHRDIKPANIILTTDGKVKITDFGIAKIASSNLTTTGQFLGTPNYMSPEQVTGAPIDGRSDIFSLGVVLYELLAKRKPFSGENLTTISYKIVHETFTPLADISKDVPEEFDNILGKALAKDPWNRFQRGKDMALSLYQTKARFEERAIFHDLGHAVSSAENLPTLKLEKMSEIVRQATPTPGPTPVSTPPTSTPSPKSLESVAPPASPASPLSTVKLVIPASYKQPPADTPSSATPAKPEDLQPADRLPAEASSPALSSVAPEPASPPDPYAAPAAAASGKVWRAHGNSKYWWGIVVGLVAIVAVLWIVAIRARQRSHAEAQALVAANSAEVELRKEIDRGKSLYAAGQYAQALDVFHGVLQRDPGSKTAREYSQMSEEGLGKQRTQTEAEERTAQIASRLQNAREALGQNDFEKALSETGGVLDLDPGNAEATKVAEDARKGIAAARQAELKKNSRRNSIASAGSPRTNAARPSASAAFPPQARPPVAPNSPATIRLTFSSPIQKGYLMVAINDSIIYRKNFDFGKARSGTVSDTLHASPGSTTVKVWLTTPDSSVKGFQTIPVRFAPGESRDLTLSLEGKTFSAHLS